MQEGWEDLFLWYLWWLYQYLGGNPGDLQNVPTVECMDKVADYYVAHGVPGGRSSGEQQTFRSIIHATREHMKIAPVTMDPAVLVVFESVLDEMESEANSINVPLN